LSVPTLLSTAGQEDPTLLAPIEKVLGLALKLNLTMLGPAMKPGPIAFGRESNAPPPKLQFLTKKKKHSRETPPRALQYL